MSLSKLFVPASLFALVLAACAPDSSLEVREEETVTGRDGLAVPFVQLDVSKSDANPGLTVIRKRSQYVQFFGAQPPADVDFNKHWVLHYALGARPTGGYAVEFLGVDRNGVGPEKKLTITTLGTEPGPGCMVTQAFTNPQATVRIAKQQLGIGIDQVAQSATTDCSEPDFCLSALCAEGTRCDEDTDSCIDDDFCPLVRCAAGHVCDEAQNACIPSLCDPDAPEIACPASMRCVNQIVCITQPCPAEYRCELIPEETCQSVGGYEGSCTGNVLKYCEGATEGPITTVECETCGWVESEGFNDCL